MSRRLLIALLSAFLLAFLLACAGCASDSPSNDAARPVESKLTDIDSVLALRAAFNEDRGTARLLLVLSPT